jgi:hypothetical protein
MSAAEFVARTRADSGGGGGAATSAAAQFPPLAYSPREHYYLQADVPPELAEAQLGWGRLLAEMLEAAGAADSGRGKSGGGALPGRLRLAQAPRVWASPAGAVSPMHWDASPSLLLQLTGRKRMCFADPDQLPCAYPYPDTHLLRRRARVNPAAPDFERCGGRGRAPAGLTGGRGNLCRAECIQQQPGHGRGPDTLPQALHPAPPRPAPQVPTRAPPAFHGGRAVTRRRRLLPSGLGPPHRVSR